jgi:enoyl-CoA hydratase
MTGLSTSAPSPTQQESAATMKISVAGPVLNATLDAPPANALGAVLVAELEQLLDRVEQACPAEVKVLIFSGRERFFCAGVDLALISETAGLIDGPDQMVAFIARLHDLYRRIERLPIPTIAMMEGSALGGGLELALSCDFRVANTESRYGLPEIKLGMLPGAGGTQRLPRLIGRAQALRLILRGEMLSGREATELGVVNWAMPAAELAPWTMQLAEELADRSSFSISAIKNCIDASEQGGTAGYALELAATQSLMTDPLVREQLLEFLARSTRTKGSSHD